MLISFAGDVKIIDFGVAKASVKETHTKMGVIKGKLLYMAPEQAMAKDLDGRADLFAVGLCLYKMLTHELPFAGDNEFQIYNNILSKDIVPPKQLNPDVPEELNQIVMTLLQRDPDKRYQDGYAAKQDLDRCLHNIAPGYTINRLSRFIEQNFSKVAREKAKQNDDSTEASRPEGIAPATPASNEVDTGQITAERREKAPSPPIEGDPTVNMSRGDALSQLEHVREPAGASSKPDGLPGPPALPDEPMSDSPARTQTNADQTGEFTDPADQSTETESEKNIPPVLYAIIAMVVVIAGMISYALFAGSSDTDPTEPPGDSRAVAQKPEAASVAIRLDTDPQGATVMVDGETFGTTPADFELEKSNKPVTISFGKDGFDSKRIRLVPNSSIDRVIALTRSLDDEAQSDADAGNEDVDGSEQIADNNDEAPKTRDEPDPRNESGGREPDRDAKQDTASGSASNRESSAPVAARNRAPKPEVNNDLTEKPVLDDESRTQSDQSRDTDPEDPPVEDEDDDFIPVLDNDRRAQRPTVR